MRYLVVGFLALLFAFGMALYVGTAEDSHEEDTGIVLEKGRNEVQLDRAILVKELVVLNPEIEYVSYNDEFLNKQISYLNVFGGVGNNFLMEPGKVYEISVRKEIELTV